MSASDILIRFWTTKHSWRGKYKRVFALSERFLSTLNPSTGMPGVEKVQQTTGDVTNKWKWASEVYSLRATPDDPSLVLVCLKKGKSGTQVLKFACEYRSRLLTEAQRLRSAAIAAAEADGTRVALAARKSGQDPTLDGWTGGLSAVVPAEIGMGGKGPIFEARKYTRDERWQTVLLAVSTTGLEQIVPDTRLVVSVYDYVNIGRVAACPDVEGGFVVFHGCGGRMHLFSCDDRKSLVRAMADMSKNCVGMELVLGQPKEGGKKEISFAEFTSGRLGADSDEDSFHSLAEFNVAKRTIRHVEMVNRVLLLTERCVVERDASTYGMVSSRSLNTLSSLVRYAKDPQSFALEWDDGSWQVYTSTERDTLLASIVDGARTCGNMRAELRLEERNLGLSLVPPGQGRNLDVELMYLRVISHFKASPAPPGSPASAGPAGQVGRICAAFNANVGQCGVMGHAKERKPVREALQALLFLVNGVKFVDWTAESLSHVLACFRRLLASVAGVEMFSSMVEVRQPIVKFLWKCVSWEGDDIIPFLALDALTTTISPVQGENHDPHQEKINKEEILSSGEILQSLVQLLEDTITSGSVGVGVLVVNVIVDFLTYVLCQPFSDTTDARQFEYLLKLVTNIGRPFFKLFSHPCVAVVKGAGMLMKAIIEESPKTTSAMMQTMALEEGALLHHLHAALFTKSVNQRHVELRELSRYLVAMWAGGHEPAMEMLHHVIPLALLNYLFSKETAEAINPVFEDGAVKVETGDQKARRKAPQIQAKPNILMRRFAAAVRRRKKARPFKARPRQSAPVAEGNWELFWIRFDEDHERADLMWNPQTREELREALEGEIRAFGAELMGGKKALCWNHIEFAVNYPSLDQELKVGNFFLRLLLSKGSKMGPLKDPLGFLDQLYHRLILEDEPTMQSMCLQGMSLVYRHFYETIGEFEDLPVIVAMIRKAEDCLLRDRLLLFLDKLLLDDKNAHRFMDCDGIPLLVDILTLVHLQKGRAAVPMQQANLLTSGDEERGTEKEWYYRGAGGEKVGPISEKEVRALWDKEEINRATRFWAQGQRGWLPLSEVCQLKWTILSKRTKGVFNETKVGLLILRMLHRLCTMHRIRNDSDAVVFPIPRAKRILSDPNVLPHIVQVLLTLDPDLVERTAVLLHRIVEDNPAAMSKLYQTGIFFFIMMYPGSNFLKITELLQAAHVGQHFREDKVALQDLKSRSILAPILPEAMVYLLGTYGADKFTEVFLGDFDTPESIWNNEMRRHMISKVALHIANFAVRLPSNTKATYQYFPIPTVLYPQLENELFCHVYYLRNLCDMTRFSEWHIKHQVELLAAILVAWRRELEEKEEEMTEEQARVQLGLEPNKQQTERQVRRAYYKLAAKYHPDKNPEGRDIFEQVQLAYEVLNAAEQRRESGSEGTGGGPVHVSLILQAQIILFNRFPKVLKPYKYAGYPMLLSTILRQSRSDELFREPRNAVDACPGVLVQHAVHLAQRTIAISPLNAEELRREEGIVRLATLFTRYVDVLTPHSEAKSLSAMTAMYTLRTFTGLAAFPSCRADVEAQPRLLQDIVRTLFLESAHNVVSDALCAMAALSLEPKSQGVMFGAGAVWHCVMFLFGYDYTLEEEDVAASEESNVQQMANQRAVLAAKALSRLGGYYHGDNSTPHHRVVRRCCRALLTPPLEKLLKESSPAKLLRNVNLNHHTPMLIWDVSTRDELRSFVEKRLEQGHGTGNYRAEEAATFKYSAHLRELQVAGVFLRLYDEQPETRMGRPGSFLSELFRWLDLGGKIPDPETSNTEDEGKEDKPMVEEPSPEEQARRGALPFGLAGEVDRKDLMLVLKCIGHVIRHHRGGAVIEVMRDTRRLSMLFGLLQLANDVRMQTLVLSLIEEVIGLGIEVVSAIVKSNVLGSLLSTLDTMPDCRLSALRAVHAMAANGKAVGLMAERGLIVYLLNLFQMTRGIAPEIRANVALCLVRVSTDKASGRKIVLLLNRLIPAIFLDLMKDDPEKAVEYWDTESETPELVWGSLARGEFAASIKQLMDNLTKARSEGGLEVEWRVPRDYHVKYSQTEGELCVGGVFVRLFLEQPKTILKNPRRFVDALFRDFVRSATDARNQDLLVQLSTAIVTLLTEQPVLASHVAQLGHIAKVFDLFALEANEEVEKRAMCVVNVVLQLAESKACVKEMGKVQSIAPMMKMLAAQPQYGALVTGCLSKIFEQMRCTEKMCLAEQAMKVGLVPYSLQLLESGADSMDESATVKAHLVKVLKAIAADERHGVGAAAILDESPVWERYKSQKHDLFITSGEPAQGLLMGPTVEIAGLLPAPQRRGIDPNEPPPDEDEEEVHIAPPKKEEIKEKEKEEEEVPKKKELPAPPKGGRRKVRKPKRPPPKRQEVPKEEPKGDDGGMDDID